MGNSCGCREREVTQATVDTVRTHASRAVGTAAQKSRDQRCLVVRASAPVELRSPCGRDSSSITTLHVYQANTVREVLENRAQQIGLPKTAAAWLTMQFDEAIVPHEKTLQEVGLRGQAEIKILGEDIAQVKVAEADKLDLHDSVRTASCDDKVDQVRLVLALYPEKVNAKDVVRAPVAGSPWLTVLVVVKFKMGYTPLHWAAVNGHCEVAQILLDANADPNVKDNVTRIACYAARLR